MRSRFLSALLAAGPAVLLADVLRQLAADGGYRLAESGGCRGVVRSHVQLGGAEPAGCVLALLVWSRLGGDDVGLGGVLGDWIWYSMVSMR